MNTTLLYCKMYHQFKCNEKHTHSNAKCRDKTKCIKLGTTLLYYKMHHQHLNNDNTSHCHVKLSKKMS